MIRVRNFNTGLLSILAVVFMLQPALAWEGHVIHETGDPANRVNAVILGDGYQEHELSKFESDAQKVVDAFFNRDPLGIYRNYVNFYRVDVISNESGADNPRQNVYVDTALDTTFNVGGTDRCIYTYNTTAVYGAAADAPAQYSPGMIIIIVNTTKYGGCAGSNYSVTATSSSFQNTVVHEIGHSLGDLADEYFYDGKTYTGSEPRRANVTIQTVRDQIKWKHWIDATTPIPTTSTHAAYSGLFEGGQYHDYGIYRPMYNSIMRSSGRPFGEVNGEQMILQIYNRVNPIESVSPPVQDVVITGNHLFNVTPMQPVGHNLDVKWLLDGVEIATGNTLTVTDAMMSASKHTLTVEVHDPVTHVRYDPYGLLTETYSWTLSNGNGSGDPVLASLVSPSSGTQISQSTFNLNWDTGANVDGFGIKATYTESAGVGSGNSTITLIDQFMGTSTSATVRNLPLTGGTLTVELSSYSNTVLEGTQTYNFSVFDGRDVTAKLAYPLAGQVISSDPTHFEWDDGLNALEYWLSVGSSQAKITSYPYGDLYSVNHGRQQSASVSGIPLTGDPIYVRLWTKFESGWEYEDYIFETEGQTGQAAVMSAPTPGSVIPSSTSFVWQGGVGVESYFLGVGTSDAAVRNAPYGDVFSANVGSLTSYTVDGIPQTGNDVYVMLWSKVNGVWESDVYIYKTDNPSVDPAEITTPAPGSTLSSGAINFQWDSGTNVSEYFLSVSESAVGNSSAPYGTIFSGTTAMQTDQYVSGIPLNGGNVHVRLWSKINTQWHHKDYVYQTVNVPSEPAQLIEPSSGSAINASSVYFSWDSGVNVDQYYLGVGTDPSLLTQSPYGDIYNGSVTGSGIWVNNIPLTGDPIYVKLWSKIDGVWETLDYQFDTVKPAAGKIDSPAPFTELTSSQITFNWSGPSNVQQYWISIGTQRDASGRPNGDIFYGDAGSNAVAERNLTIDNPFNGGFIYVRLWSKINNNWGYYNDYIYTTPKSSVAIAEITSPVVGSTVSDPMTLSWSKVSGAARPYFLGVATSPDLLGSAPYGDIHTGSYDVDGVASATITGLPSSGNVYVRLWTFISGQWHFRDYVFPVS